MHVWFAECHAICTCAHIQIHWYTGACISDGCMCICIYTLTYTPCICVYISCIMYLHASCLSTFSLEAVCGSCKVWREARVFQGLGSAVPSSDQESLHGYKKGQDPIPDLIKETRLRDS